LATLWDVDDAATAVVMDQLYSELRRGREPAAALRAVKRRLRADPRWSGPALWAAYVLVGEGQPVLPSRRWIPLAGAAAALVAGSLLLGLSRRG
jgi:hypothetical protein